MHPLVDHVCDWLACPLRCHVANSLHSHEVEATLVALNVTTDLSISRPCSPLISHTPVETLDPLFGAVGWHCTVGVTGEKHHPVLVLEDRVNPDGPLGLDMVAEGVLVALLPDWPVAWDIEGFTCFLHIHIVRDKGA